MQMVQALLTGTSIKVDGSLRKWDCVEYRGHGKDEIIQVIEHDSIRLMNLGTFSGTLLEQELEMTYANGQLVSQRPYYLPF